MPPPDQSESLTEQLISIVYGNSHLPSGENLPTTHPTTSYYTSLWFDENGIINPRRMQHFNPERDPVLVRSGMRLGNLAHNTYATLDREHALPYNNCEDVGIGGHFTHDGYGFFSHALISKRWPSGHLTRPPILRGVGVGPFALIYYQCQ
ncbi:uncharacterized protein F4822DRAFT_289858 [Hypoxylon trugodes]|uniref:uncharacterized protein n=1 Tax=Hypoxylon trugodes TaxID=326681 RepID=UPI00219D996F|nr:uncharacterized protein F4822DRAFT_289858 [Hypoxylon trugodes]KAI1387671.1 hypothetical protein F4822DRAFT_289858 [Hypoxylon trugodes]